MTGEGPVDRSPGVRIVVVPGGGRGGMADAADSKSVVREDVGVQVSPPAPKKIMAYNTIIAQRPHRRFSEANRRQRRARTVLKTACRIPLD
jgi:hypothetical protein